MPPRLLKALKIAVGCCAAVLVARLIGLQSSTSAGIITLLSILDTRRDTFRLAGRRLLSFFLALGIALLAFPALHYGVLAFGVFLFCYTLICYSLGLNEGLSSNVVLVTHFWTAASLSLPLICNEFLLLLIGTAIGILVNSYMQDVSGLVRRDQAFIDRSMRAILLSMSDRLEGRTPRPHLDFDQLQAYIKEALARARVHENNQLRKETRYYTEYVTLRRNQCVLLENMMEAVDSMTVLPPQATQTARILDRVAVSFHRLDNAGALLDELEERRRAFQASSLPATRAEFEARALLYQTVRDLIYLLRAKKQFADQLTEEQIRDLWPDSPQDCTAQV